MADHSADGMSERLGYIPPPQDGTEPEDPWEPWRDPEYARRREGRILCDFHTRQPDVGDDELEDFCEDCGLAAAHVWLEDPANYPDYDPDQWPDLPNKGGPK